MVGHIVKSPISIIKLTWANFSFFHGVLLSLLASSSVAAQIKSDATLPHNSVITPISGNVIQIDGGTRAGSNLFHSFTQFNVLTGGTAFFNNTLDVSNIFSRVTGESASSIDGVIQANGSANLFLLNPHGIIFGNKGQLNIGGSFLATTANAIGFGNLGLFSASTPNTPSLGLSSLLTVDPSALLFNQIVAQSIANKATLQVKPGYSLLLLGGNVSLDGGQILAPGGRVELGGLAGVGTVRLNVAGNNYSLSFPLGVARADVNLSNHASVNVLAQSGGSIVVNSHNLNLAQGSSFQAGIAPNSGYVSSQGGDIDINASSNINLQDGSFIINGLMPGATGNTGNVNITSTSVNLSSGSLLGAITYGNGDMGNVNVTSTSVNLSSGSQLGARTYGNGNAGNVIVSASDTINVDGVGSDGSVSGIGSAVAQGGKGNGGNVTITSKSLNLTNSGGIDASTFGNGNAGNITISARDSINVNGTGGVGSRVVQGATGNGGNITISTKLLNLTNGGEISSSTHGNGNAGNVTISATDSININGVLSYGYASGVFSLAGQEAKGKGGSINITSPLLDITNGGVVSARSSDAYNGGNIIGNVNTLELTGGSQIITTAYSSGSPGSINLNVKKGMNISGSDPSFPAKIAKFGKNIVDAVSDQSGIFANTDVNYTGVGGSININTGFLNIDSGANISVNSSGSGHAGSLNISQANAINLDGKSSITATTASGEGGNVTIKTNSLQLSHNSQISATAGNNGNGGNVTINANTIVALDNSNIIANAELGQGGNIQILTQGIFLSPNSAITASSQTGVNGVISVNTTGIDPRQGLVTLSEKRVDASRLVAQDCSTNTRPNASRFVVTGSGGLPPVPAEPFTIDALVEDVRLPQDTEVQKFSNSRALSLVEAQGWVLNNKGEVVLVAKMPTTGCPVLSKNLGKLKK